MTLRMSPRACLACGKHLDAASAVAEKGKYASEPPPSPGDFTLCIQCGHLMVFAEDMTLRNPTEAELAEANENLVVTHATAAIGTGKKRQ